jgi:hypothetical protein
MYSYTKIEIEKLLLDSKTEKPNFPNIVTIIYSIAEIPECFDKLVR